jgi:hypothetical protein
MWKTDSLVRQYSCLELDFVAEALPELQGDDFVAVSAS